MEMKMEMMMMRNYNISSGGLGIIKSFMEETSYNNRVVLGSLMPEWMWGWLPHLAQTWLRNYTAATLNYFFSSLLSCLYIYLYNHHHRRRHNHHSSSSKYFHISNNNNNSTITTTTEAAAPPEVIPNKKAMAMQICVAMKAMPWYVFLPTLSEYMVENGWTRCFSRISEVGWVAYIWYFGLYFIVVEFGIYWVHRWLHDIKPLYKYLHATHHIYNKQDTISPFAGLAFHPLDGIMQAAPHVIALFIVPMHFKTHIVFLFLEEIWTANIHDCIHGKLWPVMGAGYHTIHHTTYRHNYGHYTLWMDWMFGTLRDPLDDKPKKI